MTRALRSVLLPLVAACASTGGSGPAQPAGDGVGPSVSNAAATAATAPGRPLGAPPSIRVDPVSGGGAPTPAGLAALATELGRAMKELGKAGDPPPYFIGYEVHDRRELKVTGSYGALAATQRNRSRALDVDVRVGDYKLDSTHALRSGGYDFSMFFGGGFAALPLDDDPDALGAVAWAETGRCYRAAAERLVKIRTQRTVKVAEEDPSDDFSRETPIRFVEPPATLDLDIPGIEDRIRGLSARFRGQPEIYESQIDFSATTLNKWMVNSEGALVATGGNLLRVSVRAATRADDGMELERFESFDASSLEALPDDDAVGAAIDAVIADLKALRRAPLAEPFVGPAILEGRAAGVFFHEIFGHRVEGHRQKNEDEGQTFAKKIGEAVMPSFISVWDDPALRRIGRADLSGFYRFDDEAVAARRATLIDRGVLRGFLMGRSPTRGFDHSNGHGRRQEGRAVVARQGNLVVEPAVAVPLADLRRRLRDEAKRQGRPYGLLFRDISGGFTNTARYGPQAFKVLPILVYRVWIDGRPDELIRGADLVGTPLTSLSKILAAADDWSTFNGYCGAESGFVPVSATSPSLLVEQIEVERKDKGQEKPPALPAPTLRQDLP